MKKVQFFDLERSIQDRFVASTRGSEIPVPLLYRRAPLNSKAVALLATSALLLLGLGLFAFIGFGKLGHTLARDPMWTIAIYAGGAAIASGCLFVGWRLWDKDDSLPFMRGVFVYPVGVVDARTPEIKVYELTTLQEMRRIDSTLKLEFQTGESFEFAAPDAAKAESIESSLKVSQNRASMPPSAHSQREGVLQSPLLDTGFPNPFGPKESLRPETLKGTPLWFGGAVALGLLLGMGAFYVRNHASQGHLYFKARSLDTTASYRAFLASGAVSKDVTEILLPRAELRDAIAKGGADPIEAFLDKHKNSKVAPEAEAALRTALLTELAAARAKNSLSALREFRANDPRRKLVEQERLSAETALYRAVLAQFQSISAGTPEQTDFFARLLEYSRRHGPSVKLRFRRRLADSVDKTEQQVKKSAYYIGPPALPKQYFDAAHSEAREAKIASQLIERLSAAFPRDVLTFEVGEPVSDDGSELPELDAATLLITHRIDMSGPFTSTKPRGAFVGIGFAFKAAWVIPGDSKPLVFQHSAWMPPHLRKISEEHKTLPEMYAGMAEEAFSRFFNKYQAALLRS